MRLIDADALISAINQSTCNWAEHLWKQVVCDVINNQPTAFDTEKVVEKLEEMKNNKDCQVYCYEFYKKKCMIHKKAIDIVKKGGVE